MKQVIEEAVHLDDIRVPEVHLNLDLSRELLHHVLLLQIFLREDFDSAHKTALLFLGQNNLPVSSFAQLSDDLEVVDTPFFVRS